MIYKTSIETEKQKVIHRFTQLVDNKKDIELKGLSDKRSAKQNRALHKLFVIMCEQLNELGMEFQYTGVKGSAMSVMYTPTIVKDLFWRPIQLALFGIESTKDINTEQINKIVDVISKFFGERGVVVEFPSIEQLIK
tara:strand:+ start:191 stop:601 length:411 start_codon:yes stop_codon:yes gene_type:complete